MKKSIVFILISLLCFCGVYAQYVEGVTIENHTGTEIWYIYMSPSSSDSWEEDVLGEDGILYDDESKDVSFYDEYCYYQYWDILVEDADENEFYWEEIDLWKHNIISLDSTENGIELNFDTTNTLDFIVYNETDEDIYYMYASPTDSDYWEEDILGEYDVLAAGDSYHVSFPGYTGVYSWDFMIEDYWENEFSWENIDLNTVSAITLYQLDNGDFQAEFN